MIKPYCFICSDELDKYGAILLSPPEDDRVLKRHICVDCYTILIGLIKELASVRFITKKVKR